MEIGLGYPTIQVSGINAETLRLIGLQEEVQI